MRFITENPVVSCFMLAIIGITVVLTAEIVRPYPFRDKEYRIAECIRRGFGEIIHMRSNEIVLITLACKTTFEVDSSTDSD